MAEAKKCKHNQIEIDAKLNESPQCQADSGNRFVRQMIIAGIGIIVLSFAIFSAGCQSDEKSGAASTSASSNAKPATTTTSEITEVDLTAFIAEFDASESAALYKYKDKYVQLSGYVNKFRAASAAGTFAVIVPNPGQQAGFDDVTYPDTAIECLFNKADIPTLTYNEKVTVKGQASNMAMERIEIKNCSVVK